MNPELRQLYQDTILDHGKNPRNCRIINPCTHKQSAHNPVCGDQLVLYLNIDEQIEDYNNAIIKDIAFKGQGCAISMASASIMTQLLKGKPVQEAMRLYDQFHSLITQKDPIESDISHTKLKVLAGVNAFPARVKCATLAWHALEHSLTKSLTKDTHSNNSNQDVTSISTE